MNLGNHQWFTKLNPSKLTVPINNLLANLFIHQTFFVQIFIHLLSSNTAAKLYHYRVSLFQPEWFSVFYTYPIYQPVTSQNIFEGLYNNKEINYVLLTAEYCIPSSFLLHSISPNLFDYRIRGFFHATKFSWISRIILDPWN